MWAELSTSFFVQAWQNNLHIFNTSIISMIVIIHAYGLLGRQQISGFPQHRDSFLNSLHRHIHIFFFIISLTLGIIAPLSIQSPVWFLTYSIYCFSLHLFLHLLCLLLGLFFQFPYFFEVHLIEDWAHLALQGKIILLWFFGVKDYHWQAIQCPYLDLCLGVISVMRDLIDDFIGWKCYLFFSGRAIIDMMDEMQSLVFEHWTCILFEVVHKLLDPQCFIRLILW